jgi:oleandomycin transport system ATP-binding protein
VLLTTQYLEEADRLADHIVVVDHGRVIEQGSSDELKARAGGQSLQVRPIDPNRLGEVAAALAAVSAGPPLPGPAAGTLSAPITEPEALPALVRRLDAAGIAVAELAVARPTLDDVFLALTGHATANVMLGAVPADDRSAA